MIKTKSMFLTPSPDDGTRILITAGIPNKLKIHFDKHIKELGPSLTLLHDYKYKGIEWTKYTERFLEEMKSPSSQKAIKKLAKRSLAGETITLLCWEGEQNPHCHRYIVKKLIKEMEIKLKRIKTPKNKLYKPL